MNTAFHHSANAVLMVRPVDFEFNEQTAMDNEFMKYKEGVTELALLEFEKSVEILRSEGIHVVVVDKPDGMSSKIPDAVFPNNWFGTTRDGKLIVYTMATENRRAETECLNHIKQLLAQDGFAFHNTPLVLQEHMNQGTDLSQVEPEHVLEGTGAFIIDHMSGVVYGAKSCRCNPTAMKKYMELRSQDLKEAIMFETKSSNGKEIYHANVMLSIGTKFAVVCADSIVENPECEDCVPRSEVLRRLAQDRVVISITHEQAEKYFCANILEVRGSDNQAKIVMSSSAYAGFTEEQKELLSQFGKLVPIPIDNAIEYVGGGSARCMLAEIFLPRQHEVAVDTLDALCWFVAAMQQQATQEVVAQEIPVTMHIDNYYDTMIEGVAV
jgi:hypothetical protein